MKSGNFTGRMRGIISLVVLTIAVTLIAGCGGDEPDQSPTPSAASSETPSAGSPTSTPPSTSTTASFPVTIDHKYGSTTVPEEPQRIVTVGLRDHDTVLALGVKPIAVREWWGNQPFATWPWAQDELGDAEPVVLGSGELDFEQIAALKPDLILGVYSGMTEEEYETLSHIAPTVAQSGDYPDWGTPWQTEARVIGRALGQEQRVNELISGIDARFAEVRSQHPEFEGKTAAVVSTWGEGAYWIYGTQDARGQFMTALGFEIPAEVASMVPDTEFGANVSDERVESLDLDAVVWFAESSTDAPLDSPLYKNLRVAKEGRDIVLPETTSPIVGAFSFSSILSLPYALDELAPLLSAAVDGDPATVATTDTPDEALRLMPRPGVELGASAVPASQPGGPEATTYASVVAPYEQFGTDAAPGVFPRTVRHAMGETTLSERPTRVVVLDSTELNAVAELGVHPVGYAETAARNLPDYIQEAVADAQIVGQIAEPDLEAIAALQPDLIISNKGRHEDIYDELSAIAPTIYGETGGIAWRQNFKLYAQALGMEQEAAETVRAYEERVQRLNELLPDDRPVVSLIRYRDDGLRYYLRVNFAAQVLDDLGLSRPEMQNIEDVQISGMSLETLRDYNSDADLIVVAFDGGPAPDQRQELLDDPIWSSLPAISEGQLLVTDTALWFAGTGYGGAHALIDELVEFLGIDE